MPRGAEFKALSGLARDVFANAYHASPRVLFLLGAPGAGKGMICARLDAAVAASLPSVPVHAISAGELLRAAAREDKFIATILARGGVVPPAVSAGLVLRRLRQLAPSVDELASPLGNRPAWVAVIDGFPRTVASARAWEACGANVHGVLALEVGPKAPLAERVVLRGRSDDCRDVFARRLAQHHSAWRSLRAFYARRRLWKPIDARGDQNAVWHRAHACLRRQSVLPISRIPLHTMASDDSRQSPAASEP
jgi:adenylate kinase family enzyme